jgi:hypothetical protein
MRSPASRWTAITLLSCGLLAAGPCTVVLNFVQAIITALTIVDATA